MSETETTPETPLSPPQQGAFRLSIPMLVVLIIVAVLALYIGTQVISVLYNITVPPMPPLPAGARLQSSTSTAYGVDDWTYSAASDPCQVAALYTAEGAACRISPGICEGGVTVGVSGNAALVARCFGQVDFSIFTMQYEALINRDAADANATQLQLNREIFWIGEGRQAEVRSTEIPTLTP
jgi:hypothetical protein